MTCSRCSGLTVEDHFLDFEGSYGQMWTASWRCVNCGHVHDSSDRAESSAPTGEGHDTPTW